MTAHLGMCLCESWYPVRKKGAVIDDNAVQAIMMELVEELARSDFLKTVSALHGPVGPLDFQPVSGHTDRHRHGYPNRHQLPRSISVDLRATGSPGVRTADRTIKFTGSSSSPFNGTRHDTKAATRRAGVSRELRATHESWCSYACDACGLL